MVLEKTEQAANAWRNDRWDSFALVTPNWSFRLPGAEYRGDDPDGFMRQDEIVKSFDQYVKQYQLPIQLETNVISVERSEEKPAYLVKTDQTSWEAKNVVVATGLFQKHKVPAFASQINPSISQLYPGKYTNPQALPPGAVLVVGSAQSGAQIAEKLYQSGRIVYLCTGSTGRVPRRYRGKDVYEWLHLIGFLDRTADLPPSPNTGFAGNPHVSGRDSGHNLNLHQFARDGVGLLGRLQSASENTIYVASNLKENLTKSDEFEKMVLNLIDSYVQQNGIDLPPEKLPELRDGYNTEEIRELNLTSAGIMCIIWTIGYSFDFSLVKLPVFDSAGFPIGSRGITDYPGLYFVGMPWLHNY